MHTLHHCRERTIVLFNLVVENLLIKIETDLQHHALSPSTHICHPNSPLKLRNISADQHSALQDNKPQITVALTEADISGALLNKPLEAHNVAAVRWWLLCCDIKLPSSCRKRQIRKRKQNTF